MTYRARLRHRDRKTDASQPRFVISANESSQNSESHSATGARPRRDGRLAVRGCAERASVREMIITGVIVPIMLSIYTIQDSSHETRLGQRELPEHTTCSFAAGQLCADDEEHPVCQVRRDG